MLKTPFSLFFLKFYLAHAKVTTELSSSSTVSLKIDGKKFQRIAVNTLAKENYHDFWVVSDDAKKINPGCSAYWSGSPTKTKFEEKFPGGLAVNGFVGNSKIIFLGNEAQMDFGAVSNFSFCGVSNDDCGLFDWCTENTKTLTCEDDKKVIEKYPIDGAITLSRKSPFISKLATEGKIPDFALGGGRLTVDHDIISDKDKFVFDASGSDSNWTIPLRGIGFVGMDDFNWICPKDGCPNCCHAIFNSMEEPYLTSFSGRLETIRIAIDKIKKTEYEKYPKMKLIFEDKEGVNHTFSMPKSTYTGSRFCGESCQKDMSIRKDASLDSCTIILGSKFLSNFRVKYSTEDSLIAMESVNPNSYNTDYFPFVIIGSAVIVIFFGVAIAKFWYCPTPPASSQGGYQQLGRSADPQHPPSDSDQNHAVVVQGQGSLYRSYNPPNNSVQNSNPSNRTVVVNRPPPPDNPGNRVGGSNVQNADEIRRRRLEAMERGLQENAE